MVYRRNGFQTELDKASELLRRIAYWNEGYKVSGIRTIILYEGLQSSLLLLDQHHIIKYTVTRAISLMVLLLHLL